MTSRIVSPLLLLLVLTLYTHAAAAPDRRPRAQLHLDPCTGIDSTEVERLFTIELGAQLSPATEPAADASQLSVTCGEAGAELRVDDPLTGKSLLRVIDVAAAPPPARPRLLALALAELLFTSWTELEITLQPDPPEDPAPRVVLPGGQPLSPTPARSAAGRLVRDRLPSSSGWRLLGLFAGQGFRSTGPLLGGGIRLGGDYAHHLGFSTDFLGHHGQTGTTLGEVSIDTLCTGAALLIHGQVLRATVRGGAGLRGGAARLIGTPLGPQTGVGATLWGPFVGPMAILGVGVRLPAHLVIELSMEAGYVVLPVGGRVDGQRAVAVEGPWLAAQLGVGLLP